MENSNYKYKSKEKIWQGHMPVHLNSTIINSRPFLFHLYPLTSLDFIWKQIYNFIYIILYVN